MQDSLENKIMCKKCGCINNMSNKFCANCGKPLSSNNKDDDHSLAYAIWGLVIFWFIFVGIPLTINGFVKGLIRKNIAAIIISSITLTIYVILLLAFLFAISKGNMRVI